MTAVQKQNRHVGGFTLIELMVVIAIIAMLMGIVFRLGGVGGESRARAITIKRLQMLENAVSGYYATFGCYPPVPLQGVSRDVYTRVDSSTGIQEYGERASSFSESTVKAALKAQPVEIRFPYPGEEGMIKYVDYVSEAMKDLHNRGVKRYARAELGIGFVNPSKIPEGIFGTHVDTPKSPYKDTIKRDSPHWTDVQVFRFGLLSFLLPRFQIMMSGDQAFYTSGNDAFAQWNQYNTLPCKVRDGTRYAGWEAVHNRINDPDSADRYEVCNLPSERACARWMANMEGIVRGGGTYFGVDTNAGTTEEVCIENPGVRLYRSNGIYYVLNSMTVEDGWGNEFLYYSDTPFQSHKLWSAGPDGKSFPPWIPISSLKESQRKEVSGWVLDDIDSLKVR